jgi:class 3 adenylate cyclase
MNESYDVRYARAPDGAYIAYMTTGDGPIDIVWQPEIYSNVDVIWQLPRWAAWLRGLANISRLILHDRRGTGASSRNVSPPNLETRVADCIAVLDAVASERPVLGGELEGGAASVLFAAMMPERVHSLFWWYPAPRSTRAPDYPWGGTDQDLDRRMKERATWGTPEFDDPDDPASPWGLLSRQSSTPDVAVELELIWRQTDVRGALRAVTAPTLLMAREQDRKPLTYLAGLMPDASVRLFPGTGDSLPQVDEQPAVLRAIREFIGVETPEPDLETVLATVLFTDIVGSTERQAKLGDRDWKELLERHHILVRGALERWRGVENDTAGDGFYATFDGPARAIHCAEEVTRGVRGLGIEVRAGVHTGECTMIDGKIGGIGVAIGSRVASAASASEVLVSQTVKDLVAGSGFAFEFAGDYELKGVPDRWRLYRVVSEPH